jgi:hypothetical protein
MACLVLLPAASLLVSGCGGIAASQAISPLDFLLPGILKNDVPQTNAPLVVIERPAEVASAR